MNEQNEPKRSSDKKTKQKESKKNKAKEIELNNDQEEYYLIKNDLRNSKTLAKESNHKVNRHSNYEEEFEEDDDDEADNLDEYSPHRSNRRKNRKKAIQHHDLDYFSSPERSDRRNIKIFI